MSFRIERVLSLNEEALTLLNEYYEALSVIRRDDVASLSAILADASSALWLAYLDDKAVGCVMLKRMQNKVAAAECKRLYVSPKARGRGIAQKLMDVLEGFAEEHEIDCIYLDTNDRFHVALELYRKRGYRECERYNDNPQATRFLCRSSNALELGTT